MWLAAHMPPFEPVHVGPSVMATLGTMRCSTGVHMRHDGPCVDMANLGILRLQPVSCCCLFAGPWYLSHMQTCRVGTSQRRHACYVRGHSTQTFWPACLTCIYSLLVIHTMLVIHTQAAKVEKALERAKADARQAGEEAAKLAQEKRSLFVRLKQTEARLGKALDEAGARCQWCTACADARCRVYMPCVVRGVGRVCRCPMCWAASSLL